jgi:hypothetical protein
VNLLKKLSVASSLLVILAIPALAGVTVNNPGNGASVTSPFDLVANAATCSSQSVSSMGFSLDSGTDTTVVHSASISAQVTAAAGKHTLHVKAWGDKGEACVTDVAITVAGDTPASPASGVSVSTPANGASVTSPFALSAAAATCSSQPVNAMGYSLDSGANTAVVESKSLTVQVTAAAGTHTLHVKSWGSNGASCDTNLTLTVGDAATVHSSSSSSSGVTVSTPANDASVTSPFGLSAKASTCSSQSVSAMGYSLDSSSNGRRPHAARQVVGESGGCVRHQMSPSTLRSQPPLPVGRMGSASVARQWRHGYVTIQPVCRRLDLLVSGCGRDGLFAR